MLNYEELLKESILQNMEEVNDVLLNGEYLYLESKVGNDLYGTSTFYEDGVLYFDLYEWSEVDKFHPDDSYPPLASKRIEISNENPVTKEELEALL